MSVFDERFRVLQTIVRDWDAPTDGVDAGAGRSPSPRPKAQHHSVGKDWSVLAGGGSLPDSQNTKPKWLAPESEIGFVHFVFSRVFVFLLALF